MFLETRKDKDIKRYLVIFIGSLKLSTKSIGLYLVVLVILYERDIDELDIEENAFPLK
jgi:hypothetical protein